MNFECPHCGQKLEIATMHVGRVVPCPNCQKDISVPHLKADEGDFLCRFTDVKKTLQSNINRGSLTITQYMSRQGLEGGVDLSKKDSQDSSKTASDILTAEQGRKYELGDVVASGGMGAILDAKDVNVRRHVAMKVMLGGAKPAEREEVLRFIEEAQVMGQLEHPNIVPLHELGVDAGGNVFYTMKYVRGVTLKAVLKGIREGDRKTTQEYSLMHLLNVLQRVCDAVAFAHSKRVIHRDLKPENIMVGEYGEVQIMDWGLAKVLPRSTKVPGRIEGAKALKGPKQKKILPKDAGKSAAADEGKEEPKKGQLAIESLRGTETGDTLKTMAGHVMGTPGFMAPEQARGEVEKVDEASDIYSLGAILYNILTLEPPITGTDPEEMLARTEKGEITPPTEHNTRFRPPRRKATAHQESQKVDGRETGLEHLPGGRVPEALSAVAMKALATEPRSRYVTVKEFQREIEAYQNGFATRAEGAGAWTLFKLFVKRHKAMFTLAAASLLVIAAGSAGFMLKVLASERKAVKALFDFKAEQVRRQAERNESAPALVETAKVLVERKDWRAALAAIRTAVEYDPQLADARLVFALLLTREGKYAEASEQAREYMRLKPGEDGKLVMDVCQTAARQGREATRMAALSDVISRHGMPILAVEFAGAAGKRLEFYRVRIEKAWTGLGGRLALGSGDKLELNIGGRKEVMDLSPLTGIPLASLDLGGTSVGDLSPLKGMPLERLTLDGCGRVTSLSPLKGMPLTFLNIGGCGDVTDLSVLKGMPLINLNLHHCVKLTDLSPLKGMPLTTLILDCCCNVTDLSPLKGMPLTSLDLASCVNVTDLSPLKGMPLKTLNLHESQGVTDLSPLKGMPLQLLEIENTKVTDLNPLTGMKTLTGFRHTRLVISKINTALAEKDLERAAREAKEVINGFKDVPVFADVVKCAGTLVNMLEKPGVPPLEAPSFEGHHYLLMRYALPWEGTKQFCEKLGAHLATITSKQEQDWALRTFGIPGDTGVWLGGTDEVKEGEWKWVTGEKWEFTNWAPGHPANIDGEQKANALALFNGVWAANYAGRTCWWLMEWDR